MRTIGENNRGQTTILPRQATKSAEARSVSLRGLPDFPGTTRRPSAAVTSKCDSSQSSTKPVSVPCCCSCSARHATRLSENFPGVNNWTYPLFSFLPLPPECSIQRGTPPAGGIAAFTNEGQRWSCKHHGRRGCPDARRLTPPCPVGDT